MVSTRSKIKKSRTTQQACHSSGPDQYDSSDSAAIVASNDDLLTDILLRLPNKSVAQFKSVSKHWLSLITHPRFALRRTSYPLSPSGIFLYSKYIPFDNQNPSSSPPFQAINYVFSPFGRKILQSCNGLLCCRRSQGYPKYFIYNPTTMQFTTLPPLPGSAERRRVYCMILAFDPSRSPHYKVICIRDAKLNNHLQLEMYSSQTGTWRLSVQPFPQSFPALYSNLQGGVYWNGAVHWVIRPSDSFYFKIHEERLERLPMPPLPDRWHEGNGPSYFGESCGHLHLVETFGPSTICLNVYEMERDHSGWYVKYRIDLDELPIAFPEMVSNQHPTSRNYHSFQILTLVRGEREEDSFMVMELPGKAIQYNIVDKTFKMIYDFFPGVPSTSASLYHASFMAHQYIESLLCV